MIPNRDDRWREKFFVFKINPASVGDFDFGRIPREWSDGIEPFCPVPMTPELRGLIATLRRGSPRWLAFTVDQIRAAYALPPGGNRATLIGLVAPVRLGKGHRNIRRSRRYPIVLTSPLKSGRWNELRKLDADRLLDRGRRLSFLVFWLGRCRSPFPWVGLEGRRPLQPVLSVIELLMTTSIHRFTDADVLEEINSVSSNSPGSGLPPPLRASSEATSNATESKTSEADEGTNRPPGVKASMARVDGLVVYLFSALIFRLMVWTKEHPCLINHGLSSSAQAFYSCGHTIL
ncbi:hypothetical protein F2Q69_00022536 [Brassica cretica]|uniref:Uncharacterized protein n=1 Tax=Brassica cretica TaxID=69181 RepID=A0A8S9Q751_BRACR|nr:hypothetical protein F2Q69_00022536 [Brassica cretica]